MHFFVPRCNRHWMRTIHITAKNYLFKTCKRSHHYDDSVKLRSINITCLIPTLKVVLKFFENTSLLEPLFPSFLQNLLRTYYQGYYFSSIISSIDFYFFTSKNDLNPISVGESGIHTIPIACGFFKKLSRLSVNNFLIFHQFSIKTFKVLASKKMFYSWLSFK